jgi:iron-sulfur cluster assembly accessory protein
MLEITPSAIQEFKQALKANEGKTIRIYSIPGGCCGPSVGMAIVDQGETDDETITRDGLVVYIEKKASTALAGVTIDFVDEPGRKGFSMKNPASDGCCG